MVESKDRDDYKLIYQRIIGHRMDLPLLSRWNEMSEAKMPTDIREDWVRGKHAYTLIFWSRGFAKSIEISGQSDQQMLSKLD